ncbi:DUF4252 domain-containing protein [Pseudozobellia thermophila]|uniref:DUF4252 domain-containing protein n=1 Tax=Pseudozobellia thermophila TaxID=192903 RepID=A0A1M6FF75_9FLAO|nr:DUF4252 domain-containing protein [Pseudozobellia thermophila]SHI96315.1 protein of unknown function [Pseudozobellia thermophila]
MKTIKFTACLIVLALASACSPTRSLQEYYVDNSENPNFMALDLPVSLLNIERAGLTEAEREALGALRKLNVLAFKKTPDNQAEFLTEKTKVKSILRDSKFVELMKINTGYGKATIKYLGDENAIDEVVIYGDNDDKGFLLVRVLGENMNPAKMIQFLQALEKSDYKGEGLGPLGELLKG